MPISRHMPATVMRTAAVWWYATAPISRRRCWPSAGAIEVTAPRVNDWAEALDGERPGRRNRMSARGDWQAGGAVKNQPVPVDRLAGEGQAGEPGQQRREGDLCLEPGKRGAQAVMNPAAER